MPDTTTAIAYYQDLLLYQYVNLAQARAVIGLLAEQFLADLVILDIGNAFDLDTAVGAQLDVLGEILVLDRRIGDVIDRPYMRWQDYTTYSPAAPTVGFIDYTDLTVNANSFFYRYAFATQNFSDLADDEYRQLLKLKVILNQSDMTLSSIAAMLWAVFGSGVVAVDNCDMTLTYEVSAAMNRIATIAYNQGLLPKPAGVDITGLTVV